jgi:hypothetical protein
VFFAWPVYLYFEMKHFYRQGWAKTLIKFVLLNIIGCLILLVLFIAFILLTIFQI